jgi:hypothetical protein
MSRYLLVRTTVFACALALSIPAATLGQSDTKKAAGAVKDAGKTAGDVAGDAAKTTADVSKDVAKTAAEIAAEAAKKAAVAARDAASAVKKRVAD